MDAYQKVHEELNKACDESKPDAREFIESYLEKNPSPDAGTAASIIQEFLDNQFYDHFAKLTTALTGPVMDKMTYAEHVEDYFQKEIEKTFEKLDELMRNL